MPTRLVEGAIGGGKVCGVRVVTVIGESVAGELSCGGWVKSEEICNKIKEEGIRLMNDKTKRYYM